MRWRGASAPGPTTAGTRRSWPRRIFQGYFGGGDPENAPEAINHARYASFHLGTGGRSKRQPPSSQRHNMFLVAGTKESGAVYHPDTEAVISSPDNCAFDTRGRLWISTIRARSR